MLVTFENSPIIRPYALETEMKFGSEKEKQHVTQKLKGPGARAGRLH